MDTSIPTIHAGDIDPFAPVVSIPVIGDVDAATGVIYPRPNARNWLIIPEDKQAEIDHEYDIDIREVDGNKFAWTVTNKAGFSLNSEKHSKTYKTPETALIGASQYIVGLSSLAQSAAVKHAAKAVADDDCGCGSPRKVKGV